MNVAYKHLNAKLRIGDLTKGQWGSVLAGVLLMLGWGFYLSPLSTYPTIISAVYLGGVPIALAMLASYAEVNVWRFALKGVVWLRADGRYVAGAGDEVQGYRLTPDPRTEREAARSLCQPLDLSGLWDGDQ